MTKVISEIRNKFTVHGGEADFSPVDAVVGKKTCTESLRM